MAQSIPCRQCTGGFSVFNIQGEGFGEGADVAFCSRPNVSSVCGSVACISKFDGSAEGVGSGRESPRIFDRDVVE